MTPEVGFWPLLYVHVSIFMKPPPPTLPHTNGEDIERKDIKTRSRKDREKGRCQNITSLENTRVAGSQKRQGKLVTKGLQRVCDPAHILVTGFWHLTPLETKPLLFSAVRLVVFASAIQSKHPVTLISNERQEPLSTPVTPTLPGSRWEKVETTRKENNSYGN